MSGMFDCISFDFTKLYDIKLRKKVEDFRGDCPDWGGDIVGPVLFGGAALGDQDTTLVLVMQDEQGRVHLARPLMDGYFIVQSDTDIGDGEVEWSIRTWEMVCDWKARRLRKDEVQ